MTNPVMVVRRMSKGTPEGDVRIGRGCWVWCPGCDGAHMVAVDGEDGSLPMGPKWGWDGSVDAPTFTPSILVHKGETQPLCHSFIKAGRWEFLGDCTHTLAGQTVDMVPLPDWLVR